MKKLIFGLIALVMLFPNQGFSQRSGWQTAAVDAAGALGGAGSVASILSFLSLTPPGWVALGGGAIVGGVGASCYRTAGTGEVPKTDIVDVKGMLNPINKLEYVGQKHNQILIDFMKANDNKTFDSEVFYKFIKENQEKYNIDNKYIDVDFLNKQNKTIGISV